MSIATTDARHVSLYDTVTGIAFGPVFDDVPEADAFVRWFDKGVETQLVRDLGWYTFDMVKQVADKWRAFLDQHPDSDCPWDIDRDSYGIGFRGDDYACDCACHKREGGVFASRA